MKTKSSLAVLLSGVVFALGSNDHITRHISAGTIKGTECPKSSATAFRGIPYAQPPTGSRRFLPPQQYPGDYAFPGGVLNATANPSPCIQWGSGFAWAAPEPSEDCLYLSVFVPAHSVSPTLPVKVFAYGGSNTGGAMNYPLYDACAPASDAIVVTFNYRMGPLGFLTLGSSQGAAENSDVRGNTAIQDYLAALRWVHGNIEAFGGNANQVLLFGQSAGADDAFTVASLPEAKSLISSVALESGGGRDLIPLQNAQAAGEVFAGKLGCRGTSQLECLQGKSVPQLQAAFKSTQGFLETKPMGALNAALGVQPPNGSTLTAAVLDGSFIKVEPLKAGSQVPLLAGANQQDAALFTLLSYVLESKGAINESTYKGFLKQWGPLQHVIESHYPLELFKSALKASSNSSKSAGEAEAVIAGISHIASMAGYICPNYRALRSTALSASKPGKAPIEAYAYRFNHTPSCPWLWERGTPFPGPKISQALGPTHTAELPLVFANLDNQPFGNGTCNASEAERGISAALVRAWTAMAASGNPSVSDVSWPTLAQHGNCQLKSPRGVLVQQDGFLAGNINFSECELWDKLWVQLGGVEVPWETNTHECSGNTTAAGGSGQQPVHHSSGSSIVRGVGAGLAWLAAAAAFII